MIIDKSTIIKDKKPFSIPFMILRMTIFSKAVRSYKIMKLLQNECIFVSKQYIEEANQQDSATLNPYNEGVKNKVSKEDIVTDWYPIFGNSFCPFNSMIYFESPIKILWILKEPYISKALWIGGDRGGHDQATENRL